MDLRDRIPISPVCPAHTQTCADCAWGFVTPLGSGTGQRITKTEATSFTTIGGYTSSCGDVRVVTQGKKIGAIRGNSFFPARRDIPAYSRFMRDNNLTHLDPSIQE